MALSSRRTIGGVLVALFLSVSAWAETLSPQLETGRKIFVQRCSSCHAERGDKPLSTGLPLSDRTLTGEQLARAVAGRLKGSPGDEKRAVELYIRSFQKK